MKDIKMSSWLLQAVQNGEAILFLGAGASLGTRSPDGKQALSGEALRDLLSDSFLDEHMCSSALWPQTRDCTDDCRTSAV